MKGNRVDPGRHYLPPLDMGRLSGTMRLMAQWTCLRKGHDAYKILGFDVCRRCWKITGYTGSKGKMNITEDSGNGSGERFNVIRKLLKQCRERYGGFIRPLYPKKEEKAA